MRGRSCYAARHDVAGFLAGELERRRELGYPPFRAPRPHPRLGPRPRRPLRLLEELRDGLAATPSCSARRRCCACAAATARSSSAKTDAPRRLARSAARSLGAAPAMRRAGVTAVVDVDPQAV